MDAYENATGLRELADWIEENDEMLSGSDFSNSPTVLLCRIDGEEFIAAAQALGIEQSEVEMRSGYLNVTRKFGPVNVQVYIYAERVGTAKTKLRETTEWELNEDIRSALGAKAMV